MKKHNQPSPYYPIFLAIKGRRCVVIGGGQVALRKVRALLEHEASIQVISPDLCSKLNQLAKNGEIHILNRGYRVGDLKNAFIAIVATNDSKANLEVVQEAQRTGVMVNVVDNAEKSDFIVPSCVRRGDVTIAISTAGRSPSLARKLRTRFEKEFGEEYSSLALLIDEVRAEVKKQKINVNGDAWQEALDLDLLSGLLRRGGKEKAKVILLNKLKTRQK